MKTTYGHRRLRGYWPKGKMMDAQEVVDGKNRILLKGRRGEGGGSTGREGREGGRVDGEESSENDEEGEKTSKLGCGAGGR